MTSQLRTSIDQLGQQAAEIAMRAFVEKVRQDGQLEALRSDLDRAVAIIRELAREAAGKGLADAREAIDANMGEVAVLTFKAELALAGLTAAKVWRELQERGRS